jgi:hypothetical protein
MPILKELTTDLKQALGKKYDFVTHYETLLEKSKNESLRDNEAAISYLDQVIKRYKLIKATSPSDLKLQATKDSYLPLLQQHALELSVLSFSKPNDLVPRLQELDFEAALIDEYIRNIEQAGHDDDLCLTLCSSMLISQSMLSSCDSDRNHHHHRHHW